MSNQLNQANKEAVWDFWQRLNYVSIDELPALLRAAAREDVAWNVSAPVDQIIGVDAVIADFWLPLRHAFPDLKRAPTSSWAASTRARRSTRPKRARSGSAAAAI